MSPHPTKLTLGLMSAAVVAAFQPSPLTPAARSSFSQLQVAVDPSVVTRKEYQDICGVDFDSETLHQRLKSTNFLYPKHVEVVEEIGPIAGAMVDEIVRFLRFSFLLLLFLLVLFDSTTHPFLLLYSPFSFWKPERNPGNPRTFCPTCRKRVGKTR